MFDKNTYIRRRAGLKKLVGEGIIVLFGNNESPCNYPANSYAPMRQDSSFLYYFGQHRDGLVGVIDIDKDEEWLFGDDIGSCISHQPSAIESTLPTTLPPRHEDTDYGPAGHPSF